jgi:myosin-1
VNEKLQQIFINLTLKEEQEEYKREGIQWEPIKFFNNKICCDLIESKKDPIGILTLLDDTCNFPKGTDEKFLGKLQEYHSQHAHFGMAQRSGCFVIKHYAGDVEYNTDGMTDKNKDTLYNDLINLAQATNSWLIPILFPESKTADDKRKPTTAGFKIKVRQIRPSNQ